MSQQEIVSAMVSHILEDIATQKGEMVTTRDTLTDSFRFLPDDIREDVSAAVSPLVAALSTMVQACDEVRVRMLDVDKRHGVH